ncbi:PASTA domain-containing protein [Nocardia pseudobrasiliensis]|uniref:PASTA domain-containing protein n=1 Tax=Nocardia pseudobrasiliensis TaxID=45979 RepID=UPI0011C066D7|nr:PASTA domain-containing protein [Nocardia pseudobrasiliensis]
MSSTAAAASSAAGAADKCASAQWPQPLPDFRGKRLGETVVGVGLCYEITEVTGPDGNDVRQDPKALTTPWTITEQSPAPGTAVSASTPVTLKVEAAP